MFTTANGDRSNAPDFIVVLTDGRSDNQTLTWQQVLSNVWRHKYDLISKPIIIFQSMACRAQGVSIIAVAIGRGVNEIELQGLVSAPVENNIFSIESFDGLTSELASMLQESTCNSKQCKPTLFL